LLALWLYATSEGVAARVPWNGCATATGLSLAVWRRVGELSHARTSRVHCADLLDRLLAGASAALPSRLIDLDTLFAGRGADPG